MSNKLQRLFPLIPTVMHYPWGRCGAESLVGKLSHEQDVTKPCAELWVGAHEKASAQAMVDGKLIPLSELLRVQGQELLGESWGPEFANTLPFLLKILSIAKPLSIQAHPDKHRAALLHSRDPGNYPDSNHKPEMGLALTDVQLLFGLYSDLEMAGILDRFPELQKLAAESEIETVRQAEGSAESIFRAVFGAPPKRRVHVTAEVIKRILSSREQSPTERLLITLSKDYPLSDVGLLSMLILRYVELKPGEAIFITPNTPHAYLSGEVVECMANSDNVVRAGLTTKYCDISTLLEMVDFTVRDVFRVQPIPSGDNRRIFISPAREFFVEEIVGKSDTIQLMGNYKPKIVLTLAGTISVTDSQSGESVIVTAGKGLFLSSQVAKFNIALSDSRSFVVGVP